MILELKLAASLLEKFVLPGVAVAVAHFNKS